MPINPFGWKDHGPPDTDAANLEAMHAAAGAYTDTVIAEEAGEPGGLGTLDEEGHQPLAQLSPSVVSGSVIAPCVAAVVGNVAALSGIPAKSVTDELETSAGQRIFLTGQTTKSQNGPWVLAAGAWERPTDFAHGIEHKACTVLITGGETLAGTQWFLSTNASITVDTTALTWTLSRVKESNLPGQIFDAADWNILPTNTAAQNTAGALKLTAAVNAALGGVIRFKYLAEYYFECAEGVIPFKFNYLVNAVLEGISGGTTRTAPSGTRLVSTVGKGTMVKWEGTTNGANRALGGTRHIEFYGHEQANEEVLVWPYRALFMNFEDTRIAGCGGTGFRMTQLENCFFDKFCVRYSGKGRAAPAVLIDSYLGEEAGGAGGSVINHFSECEFEANNGTDICLNGNAENPGRGNWFTNCKIERQIEKVNYPAIEENQSESLCWIGGGINIGGGIKVLGCSSPSTSANVEGTLTATGSVSGSIVAGMMISGGSLPAATNAEATWLTKSKIITVKGSLPKNVVAGYSVRCATAGIPAGATVSSIGAYEEGTNSTPITISVETTAANATEARVSFGGTWVVSVAGKEIKFISTSAVSPAIVNVTCVVNGATSRIVEKWLSGQHGASLIFGGVLLSQAGSPDFFFNLETGRTSLTGCIMTGSTPPIKYVRLASTVPVGGFTWAGTIFEVAANSIRDERLSGRDVSMGYMRLAIDNVSEGVVRAAIGSYYGYQVRHSHTDALFGTLILPTDYVEQQNVLVKVTAVTPNVNTSTTTVRWGVLWSVLSGTVNTATVVPTSALAATNNASTAYGTVRAETEIVASQASTALQPGTVLGINIQRQGELGSDVQTDTVSVLMVEFWYPRRAL